MSQDKYFLNMSTKQLCLPPQKRRQRAGGLKRPPSPCVRPSSVSDQSLSIIRIRTTRDNTASPLLGHVVDDGGHVSEDGGVQQAGDDHHAQAEHLHQHHQYQCSTYRGGAMGHPQCVFRGRFYTNPRPPTPVATCIKHSFPPLRGFGDKKLIS